MNINGTGNMDNAVEGENRARGRPSGRRTRQPVTILRVINGADIVAAIANYATNHGCGVYVLSGSGLLSLPQIGRETVNYRFASPILSLTGTVFPREDPIVHARLTVYVADREGRVTGGIVVGPLVAMESVQIVTMSYLDIRVENLPLPAYNGGV